MPIRTRCFPVLLLVGCANHLLAQAPTNIHVYGRAFVYSPLNLQGAPPAFHLGTVIPPAGNTPFVVTVPATGAPAPTGTDGYLTALNSAPPQAASFTLVSTPGADLNISLVPTSLDTPAGVTLDAAGFTITGGNLTNGALPSNGNPVVCQPSGSPTNFKVGYRYSVANTAVKSSTPYPVKFSLVVAYL